LLLLWLSLPGYGQQINFSTYADYGLAFPNTPQALDFNQLGQIIADGSTYQLDVNSGNYSLIEIVGVKYLDVFITVNADNNLTGQNSGDTINFTLKAAYSNRKGDIKNPSNIPLKHINVVNDSFSIRVPVLERQNLPPGPPPTPPTNATNLDPQQNYSNPLYETLYLYLSGDLTVNANASADSYNGNISVTVSYD